MKIKILLPSLIKWLMWICLFQRIIDNILWRIINSK